MKYSDSNPPMVCMMTQSTCYRGTSRMVIKGVLWHSTGANNPTLKRYVQPDDNAADRAELLAKIGKNVNGNDWNHVYVEAGLNAWIGKLADGSVTSVQTMPWDYAPWGCGGGVKGSCNNGWIQFEICEDALTDASYFNAVYKEACELTAYLCKKYKLSPKGYTTFNGVTVPVILCHKDAGALGLGSNHADVMHWFSKYGKTMNDVRMDVAALLDGQDDPVDPVDPVYIKVGDEVEIKPNSCYYDGTRIPDWVFGLVWVVDSVSGDRVVIVHDRSGLYTITSAFRAEDLIVVEEPDAEPEPIREIQVGDVVQFTGTKQYISSGSKIGVKAKPGWVTVTRIYKLGKSRHPYHCVKVKEKNGSNVYGWVDAADIHW